jgi:uncharacterized membrane protein YebE (DUF533 family)
MRSDLLIEGVLSGLFGVRRKRSHRAMRFLTGRGGLWSNPQALLTAAGVAWGIFETLQNKRTGAADAAAPPGGAGPYSVSSGGQWGDVNVDPTPAPPSSGVVVPPPLPQTGPVAAASTAAPTPDALRVVRLAISAAHADGAMNDRERAAVMQQAVKAGIGDIVEREIDAPRPLAEIVAGVNDEATAATLYVLAFTILRADEQVTGAERIYLAQLANVLHLDAATVVALEKDTGERIDALGDQGQFGG